MRVASSYWVLPSFFWFFLESDVVFSGPSTFCWSSSRLTEFYGVW